jgi:hypothetical protein
LVLAPSLFTEVLVPNQESQRSLLPLFLILELFRKCVIFCFFIWSLLFMKIDNPLTAHRNFAYVLNSFIILIYKYIIYTKKIYIRETLIFVKIMCSSNAYDFALENVRLIQLSCHWICNSEYIKHHNPNPEYTPVTWFKDSSV